MSHLSIRSFSAIGLAATLLIVAGCSGVSVNTDYDTGTDFQELHTYRWMPAGNPPFGSTGLWDQRIRRSVNSTLQAKGLREVEANPDLLVAYHVGKQQRIQVDNWGYGYWGWGGGLSAYTYQQGTLVVDLVESANRHLVWRGTASGVISNPPPSGENAQNKMNQVVDKMFAKYPPGQ